MHKLLITLSKTVVPPSGKKYVHVVKYQITGGGEKNVLPAAEKFNRKSSSSVQHLHSALTQPSEDKQGSIFPSGR